MRLGRRHLGGKLASVGAAAVALALGATLAVGAPASAGQQSPPGAANSAAPSRTVDVMTRNLYLGADLTKVIDALATNDPQQIVGAATETWYTVQASDPAERMAAIADEIVKARPAAVGLQEVTTWTTYDYNPATGQTGNPQVAYDFLELLLKALADRGVTYHEVAGATSHNFTTPQPIPVLASPTATFPTKAVGLSDRDVILRRDDVKAWNAHHGNFQTILAPPYAPLPVARGWGSADLRSRLATFRFVNAHTEAWGPEAIRIGQVQELFAAQDAITAQSGALPMVYVGDYNSVAPNAGAYQALAQRLDDAWIEANGSDPGYTCCQLGDLSNTTSILDERIDLVMASPSVIAKSAYRTGTTPVDLPGNPWWASDHAGVVARLVIQ
jgi:hypothetical protein